MKTRKVLLLVMVVILIAAAFAGCKKAEEVTYEPLPETTIPEGLEIHFWHAMGGGLGETIEAICTMFNESNEYA